TLHIFSSAIHDSSKTNTGAPIRPAAKLTGTVHEIGRHGKFPRPKIVESGLKSLNPNLVRRTAFAATEQLVNGNTVNLSCYAKFTEATGAKLAVQLFSHGLRKQDLRAEILV